MVFFHGPGDVHHGQEHKDQGLNNRDQDLQDKDRQRYQEGYQDKEDSQDDMAPFNIPEQTHGQRNRAGNMADQLDGQHKGSKPPYRTHKLFEVFDPVDLYAHNMRHDEYHESHRHIGVQIAGRRHEPRNESDEVRGQYEQADGCDEREELHPVGTHGVDQEVLDPRYNYFHDILDLVGVKLHARSRRQ